ncbi:MAG: quinol dehydrogenase ferredoxin subunit NapH [Candidatus Electronema sp. V4]|uniref:quinol dehydrogenase ferredoxin subunit NapH n=1 Tax=Candidatus Electronema sp. V4 TaxID=3454756 RepID=UPI004055571D
MKQRIAGREAVAKKGWLRAHKWLLLRRLSQLGILGLFLLGPLAGIWIIKGTLSASTTLGFLPLTDPLIFVQSLAARYLPETAAVFGFIAVLVLYSLLGGRTYCAWVCPVNLVTDAAAWTNRRLELKKNLSLSKSTRWWLLGFIIVLSMLLGSIVWEAVNPVTVLQRGLLFGMGLGWLLLAAIFIFDAFVLRHGWCGHLCPVGAAYSLLGFTAALRVKAAGRDRCTDCMDCFTVCPEPQVIRPALKGGANPVILSQNCLNCGRCMDVCPQDVFCFSQRT